MCMHGDDIENKDLQAYRLSGGNNSSYSELPELMTLYTSSQIFQIKSLPVAQSAHPLPKHLSRSVEFHLQQLISDPKNGKVELDVSHYGTGDFGVQCGPKLL